MLRFNRNQLYLFQNYSQFWFGIEVIHTNNEIISGAWRQCGLMGIYPLQSGEKSKFNCRNIGVLLCFGLHLISITAFLLFNAKTFQEYAVCIFPWCTIIFTWAGISVHILLSTDVFRYIECLEKTIESRKWMNRLYEETSERIENYTRMLLSLLVKITIPMGNAPIVILSYYHYFATDLGSEAFIMPSYTK